MVVIHAKKGEKKTYLERLLTRGTVMVFVDSRKEKVIVPPQHQGNPRLPLNLDYAFQIPDFKIFDDRVEASLSFDSKDFFCVLPYDAVYAMTSQLWGELVIFPESVPKEFVVPAQQESSIKPKKRHLKLVE